MAKRTAEEIKKIRMSRYYRDTVRTQQLLDFPICKKCEEKDILKEAVQVDHIIPLEEGGEPYDPSNLQSLCFRCHVLKSASETRARRKVPKQLILYK